MKIPVSVAIITYNEEKNIRRCLESCIDFEEIIVIDSGSTDETVSIASKYTDKIFTREFINFSDQKNYALSKCSLHWIFSIDADEVISDNLKKEISSAIHTECNTAAYAVPRKTRFIGRWINYCGWYPDYVIRLFKRSYAEFADVQVHEYVTVNGNINHLNAPLLHYSYTTLQDYFQKFQKYTTLAAVEMNNKNKRFNYFMFIYKPLFKFIKMFIVQKGFLDGMHGIIVCILGAIYTLTKYLKYWEIIEHEKN